MEARIITSADIAAVEPGGQALTLLGHPAPVTAIVERGEIGQRPYVWFKVKHQIGSKCCELSQVYLEGQLLLTVPLINRFGHERLAELEAEMISAGIEQQEV
jgi:hypothetical protein